MTTGATRTPLRPRRRPARKRAGRGAARGDAAADQPARDRRDDRARGRIVLARDRLLPAQPADADRRRARRDVSELPQHRGVPGARPVAAAHRRGRPRQDRSAPRVRRRADREGLRISSQRGQRRGGGGPQPRAARTLGAVRAAARERAPRCRRRRLHTAPARLHRRALPARGRRRPVVARGTAGRACRGRARPGEAPATGRRAVARHDGCASITSSCGSPRCARSS